MDCPGARARAEALRRADAGRHRRGQGEGALRRRRRGPDGRSRPRPPRAAGSSCFVLQASNESAVTAQAHVLLPAATHVEDEGTFTQPRRHHPALPARLPAARRRAGRTGSGRCSWRQEFGCPLDPGQRPRGVPGAGGRGSPSSPRFEWDEAAPPVEASAGASTRWPPARTDGRRGTASSARRASGGSKGRHESASSTSSSAVGVILGAIFGADGRAGLLRVAARPMARFALGASPAQPTCVILMLGVRDGDRHAAHARRAQVERADAGPHRPEPRAINLPGLRDRPLGGISARPRRRAEDALQGGLPARRAPTALLFNLAPILAFAPVFALFAVVPVGPARSPPASSASAPRRPAGRQPGLRPALHLRHRLAGGVRHVARRLGVATTSSRCWAACAPPRR